MKINNNTRIVISGGGSGMGAASAQFLAEKGAKVFLLDINLNNAQKVAQQINATAIECNVSDSDSVEAAISEVINLNGGIEICINCAGVAPGKRIVGREGPMPLDDFKKVIDINLVGTFNVMRMCAAQMMKQEPLNEDLERGVIINTASIAAYEGQIGQAAYSASKGGVVALTLPAAREFAKFGIRVNTIAPGLIATPMLSAMPQAVQDSLAATVEFPKRLGRPGEYARLAAHIIENGMLNGEVIRLDGALRLTAK